MNAQRAKTEFNINPKKKKLKYIYIKTTITIQEKKNGVYAKVTEIL